jgi:hypothetical protein
MDAPADLLSQIYTREHPCSGFHKNQELSHEIFCENLWMLPQICYRKSIRGSTRVQVFTKIGSSKNENFFENLRVSDE